MHSILSTFMRMKGLSLLWCASAPAHAVSAPLVLLVAAVTACSAALSTNSYCDDFKKFLESPPIIEHIVVRQKMPSGSASPLVINNAFARSKNWKLFEGRWQPGGVFYREVASLDALTNCATEQVLVAAYGPHHWLSDGQPWLDSWTDSPAAVDRTNTVTTTSVLRLQGFWEALNLGIQHLPPGSIHWSGTNFSVRSPVFKGLEVFEIEGNLLISNGVPAVMTVLYRWNGREASWINYYSYDRPLTLPFLPSRVKQYWVGHGGIELGEYEILQVKTASRPLSESEFNPERYAEANHWETHVYTNQVIYAVGVIGRAEVFEVPIAGRPYDGSRSRTSEDHSALSLHRWYWL